MLHKGGSIWWYLKILPHDSKKDCRAAEFILGKAADWTQSDHRRVFDLKKGEECDYTIDSR